MKTLLLTLMLSLGSLSGFAQYIGVHEIEEQQLKAWIEDDLDAYRGVYHFGEGDGSHLLLLPVEGGMIAQIKEGYFEENTGLFKWRFQNLTGLRLQSNELRCDQFVGKFVTFSDDSGDYPGLKVDPTWTPYLSKGSWEVGLRMDGKEYENWHPGRFPKASRRRLSQVDLTNLSPKDLRIIRNEIFARYGYVFEKDGEMSSHFSKEEWYQGRHQSVAKFLTALELANIEMIKQEELRRAKG